MTICFVLPHPADGPTGGYKVVYEYANRFAADGIKVHIVYSGSIFWTKKPIRFKLSNCVRYVQHIIQGYSGRKWFPLDRHVREHLTLSMNYRHVPKADVYVATSPYTAWYINEYPIEPKRKFYLIQDYENWGPGLAEILEKTYHMQLNKIVISSWLQKLLSDRYNEESTLIQNGFDFSKFHITIPPSQKNKFNISALYHTMDRKRCGDTVAALMIVKNKLPQLTVSMFGVPQRPTELPEWFRYYQMPDVETHNRINNEAAIFVSASEIEGWGLTVGEAMICGQAVCCTDNDGHKEMAIHERTALLSPIRNPNALAMNVIRLLEDDSLRLSIAAEGYKFIKRFTWDDSYHKFKLLINNATGNV